MKITRWFQNTTACAGQRPGYGFFEEGAGLPMCLYTQACVDRMDVDAIARLAAVVERHFPARCWCERCAFSPISRLIHFNNSSETTREDIDKVLRIYTEEMERG